LFSFVGVGSWGVAAALPAAQDQNSVRAVGPFGVSPAVLTRVEPEYPVEASHLRIRADVHVRITVDRAGDVVDARTRSWSISVGFSGVTAPTAFEEASAAQLFIEAARDAARKWKFESTTAEWTGLLEFQFRPEGARERVELPSFRPPTVAGSARPGELVPPPPPSPGTSPIRVGDGLAVPRKIVHVPPVYPQGARDAGVQGVVILEAVIATDGSVKSVAVLRSVPLLDQAAVDAASQWRFEPARLNGEPTEVVMTLTINFTLQ
jgi:protein TonB